MSNKLEATFHGPDSNALEVDEAAEYGICSCGYIDGSFACRIRHVQMNTGAAKAAKD